MAVQDRFDQIAEAELAALEKALGELDPDEVEVDFSQGVLTLTLADGQNVVINSHHAASEIWVAAFRQAWHFAPKEEQGGVVWRTAKDELHSTLSRVLGERLGKTVKI